MLYSKVGLIILRSLKNMWVMSAQSHTKDLMSPDNLFQGLSLLLESVL